MGCPAQRRGAWWWSEGEERGVDSRAQVGWLAVYTGRTGKRFVWLLLLYMVCLAAQVTCAAQWFSPNGYERVLVPLRIEKQRS